MVSSFQMFRRDLGDRISFVVDFQTILHSMISNTGIAIGGDRLGRKSDPPSRKNGEFQTRDGAWI